MKNKLNQELTLTALLAVVLLLAGTFRIPSPVGGGEFQMSAPLAVLMCVYFGFKRYLAAGVLASLLGLMLGTANIFNVLIQMTFRIVAGIGVELSGGFLPGIMLSGPLGTLAARVVLGQVTQVDWLVLTAAAAPGMLFTAVLTGLLYAPGKRLLARCENLGFLPAKER